MTKTLVLKEIERLVVVVDIRAWLSHQNPTKLAFLLQQCVRTILASTSTSCRWGFKLFDSSLSPFSSHCKINKLLGTWACSTRFDSVLPGGDNSPSLPEVLSQFCSALNCLHTQLNRNVSVDGTITADGFSLAPSNANFLASSLMELLSDFVWNPLLTIQEEGTVQCHEECMKSPIQLNSNLVILFSTFPATHSELAHFLQVEFSANETDISAQFSNSFKKMQGSFQASQLHLCCVDVPLNISTLEDEIESLCSDRRSLEHPLSGLLNRFGWSFTYLDLLLAGFQTVPFSLLWRGLAHSWSHLCNKRATKIYSVCIQVTDVGKKPITATICKVDALSTDNSHAESFTKLKSLHISSTIPDKVLMKARQHTLVQVILRSSVLPKGKLEDLETMLGGEYDRHLVGDYILKHCKHDLCNFVPGKPAWNLLLLHLAREGRLGIIDVGPCGSACFAMLEPLTMHLAVLSLVSKSFLSESFDFLSPADSLHSSGKSLTILGGLAKSYLDTEYSQNVSAEISSQGSGVCKRGNEYQNIKSMVKPLLKRKPLNSLDNARHSGFNVDDKVVNSKGRKRVKPCLMKHEEKLHCSRASTLEELYTKSSRRSKVLKVLSCWMRQTQQEDFLSHENIDVYMHADTQLCSDNAITGKSVSQLVGHNRKCASSPRSTTLADSTQPLNMLVNIVGCETAPEDMILSSSATNLTSSNSSHGKAGLCNESLTLDDANAYIASLDQKLADCLSCSEMDLYSFSQRVVSDAYDALSALLRKDPKTDHGHILNFLTVPALETTICSKIMEVLLQPPKKLAIKYRKCRLPRFASQPVESELDVSDHVYSSEEKVREHELQILLRMEILVLMLGLFGKCNAEVTFIHDICRLLENIQFNLPGGVLEGESLLDFSNNVLKQRYKETLSTIVKEIYTSMEFNGHDDASDVEELEPSKVASEAIGSGSDAFGVEEDNLSNSDNPYSSSSLGTKRDQSRDVSLQRALMGVRMRSPCAEAAIHQELKEAEAKRERAKRFSHFASSSRDVLRVTVTPKVHVASTKKHPKHHSHNSKPSDNKPKPNHSSEREVILQTPFSERKQRSERPPLAAKKKLLVWNW